MLRDHPMQCVTCAKWAHDAERCCMACELHHSGVLQGGLQAIQQCALCRLRLALALQIEAYSASHTLQMCPTE